MKIIATVISLVAFAMVGLAQERPSDTALKNPGMIILVKANAPSRSKLETVITVYNDSEKTIQLMVISPFDGNVIPSGLRSIIMLAIFSNNPRYKGQTLKIGPPGRELTTKQYSAYKSPRGVQIEYFGFPATFSDDDLRILGAETAKGKIGDDPEFALDSSARRVLSDFVHYMNSKMVLTFPVMCIKDRQVTACQ